MTIEQRTMIRFGSIIGPFLMVLFHFPAAAPEGQTSSSFTVQTGDKITLSCENVRKDQKNCDRTTWTYRNFMQEGTIFENGQINKDAATDSSRLSLTANCSLVIKKVTLQDAGLYTCRQNLLANQDSQESLVDVSVIRVSEPEFNDDVSLRCSLQEHNYCTHTVEWVYDQKMPSGVKVISYSCRTTVTFTKSVFNQKSNIYELLKCKVTAKTTGEVQLFSFRPQSEDEEDGEKDATTTAKTATNTATLLTTRKPTIAIATTADLPSFSRKWTSIKGNATDNRKYSKQQDFIYFLRCITVSVGLAALLMLVVSVNKWAKTKERRTQPTQQK
ncbi:uncharacterized protein LOC116733776 isoform X3 [Xiphophorus hellerii]|uniref:uncharacterized protein LOC116733776 isoform X3 n=1 Tax=Xiphophorus hellerii TaxID=8084 RepID=UPI0013B409A0|nr:uncharacterized protein LOC116733776 isoform X3 [Xiphophorus hellerii]